MMMMGPPFINPGSAADVRRTRGPAPLPGARTRGIVPA